MHDITIKLVPLYCSPNKKEFMNCSVSALSITKHLSFNGLSFNDVCWYKILYFLALIYLFWQICLRKSSGFQSAYPFKIEAFFLVLQVLIKSICDTFIASKIRTTKVSFQIWKQIGPKGLNLEKAEDEEGPRSCIRHSSHSNLRGVGWCIHHKNIPI